MHKDVKLIIFIVILSVTWGSILYLVLNPLQISKTSKFIAAIGISLMVIAFFKIFGFEIKVKDE